MCLGYQNWCKTNAKASETSLQLSAFRRSWGSDYKQRPFQHITHMLYSTSDCRDWSQRRQDLHSILLGYFVHLPTAFVAALNSINKQWLFRFGHFDPLMRPLRLSRNVGPQSLSDAAPHPRWIETITTPLRKPKNSRMFISLCLSLSLTKQNLSLTGLRRT
jgi:hypothetical protein